MSNRKKIFIIWGIPIILLIGTLFWGTYKKGFVDNKVFLRVGCEWIDWQNPGFDPRSPENHIPDISKFSIVIGVSAVTPVSFD